MNLVVVLGAGFSHSVSNGRLPLMDGLGDGVLASLEDPDRSRVRLMPTGDFEAWLSRLAEPQPDLDEIHNLENRALFTRISRTVRDIVSAAEQRTLEQAIPGELQRLVGMLHGFRATVATFNYDTLLERTLYEQRRDDWKHVSGIRGSHATGNRPPELLQAGMLGEGDASTFRLLKLHGSVDAYWVPDDHSGSTINTFSSRQWWWRPTADTADSRRLLLPDRVPFIVPPAAAKSAFYANPVTRQIWQDAAQALREASQVVIIGYSLPGTDLVASGMFSEALLRNEASIRIVDPAPESLLSRIASWGVDNQRLSFISGNDPVATFVSELEENWKVELTSEDARHAINYNGPMVIAQRAGQGRPVIRVERDRSDSSVAVVTAEADEQNLESMNRARGSDEPQLPRVSDLLQHGVPRTVRVRYENDDTVGVVLETASQSFSTGHAGWWLRLVPSAIPLTHLPYDDTEPG